MAHFILALDQGTSGTKAVVFDQTGAVAAKAQSELASLFPRPGFVEQRPQDIISNAIEAAGLCLRAFRASNPGARIEVVGISNQRETCLVWDADGRPLSNALVWQCKRSVDICSELKAAGLEELIRQRTGLIIDPYFSATKLVWLQRNDAAVGRAIQAGRALFGTVDSWLLWNLAGGAYKTDYTNASRTMLFDIGRLEWDRDILTALGLEKIRLPEALPCSADFGLTDLSGLLPERVPIRAMIGDSHAAAFGEGCFDPGSAKATLGTGSSIMMNVGRRRVRSSSGMVSTICFSTADRIDYALEGIIVSCGATVKWLRDQLGLLTASRDSEAMARAVPDNGGVCFIPAFAGLGAPYWKMEARAAITGLSFASTKNHIVRAALEAIAYQIKDVIVAMESDAGSPLTELNLDGGIIENAFVTELIADLLGCPIRTIGLSEVSALGAAYLAGLGAGIFESLEALKELNASRTVHRPGPGRPAALAGHGAWKMVINRLV